VGFDELGDTHLRYLKGLPGPYAMATSKYDKTIQENYPSASLDEREYNKLVEEFAGKCKCGELYKFNAPPMCPKCRSLKYENMHEEMILYD
jgi:hypothetical protein